MIRVRVPKGLEVLLLIISGSEAEKGMLILTFLISIEKEFGRLSVNIPEDARNKIEAIHELRRLIDRYSGMGTGDDAAQLYREFMANKNLFLSFLGELSGNGEPLEYAILERVAVGAATRDGFIKSHLKAAFKDNGFVNSFWWLRILAESIIKCNTHPVRYPDGQALRTTDGRRTGGDHDDEGEQLLGAADRPDAAPSPFDHHPRTGALCGLARSSYGSGLYACSVRRPRRRPACPARSLQVSQTLQTGQRHRALRCGPALPGAGLVALADRGHTQAHVAR